MRNAPIAVFDSGIGGLTVLHVLQTEFPQESFVYLGDTARLPYGTKSPETVADYAAQMARVLMTYQPKAIVIACNTASALGMESVRNVAGVTPVIGMIDPAARLAVETTKNKHIAVLGTHGTIRSAVYESVIHSGAPDVRITALPCQLLVSLAEEGWVDHPATRDIVQTYLAPILAGPDRPDTVILGCTHFPVFLPLFQRLLPGVSFIHCGVAAARALAPVLSADVPNLLAPELHVMVTDGAETFTRMAARFFDRENAPVKVHLIDVHSLAA